MMCHVCGKQRQWFVKVVRYPEDGRYDPSHFEWCISCAYNELKVTFEMIDKEKKK